MTSPTNTRRPIATTDFSEHFPVDLLKQRNVDSNDVQLLGTEEARLKWSAQLGTEAKSYFSIPSDSWLARLPSVTIGQWLGNYNAGNVQRTASELQSHLSWASTTRVLFCVSHRTIIATTWGTFTCLWDCFLATHDDCPIVIPDEGKKRSALIFTPLGDIRYVREPDP